MANKLATTIYMYNWFLKLIGAALLIGLGITLLIIDIDRLIEAFVGIVIAVYAIIRLVPFVRSQKSDLIKTINIIEITLNILIATIFIVAAFIQEEGLGAIFGYLLAGILLGRGMVHFYSISYGAEKGDHLTYFFHIATIIVASFIFARGFETSDLVMLLAFLAFLAGGYAGFESYSGYNRYRRHKQMDISKEKSVEDELPAGIEAPSKKDEEKEQDRVVS